MLRNKLSFVFSDRLPCLTEKGGRVNPKILSERRLPTGVRIVELGAGTGWLGLLLAHNLPGIERMLLTEMEEGHCLEHLDAAVELNRQANLAGVERVSTAAFDWKAAVASEMQENGERCYSPSVLEERWDFVIGSDLVYGEETAALLPQVRSDSHQPRDALLSHVYFNRS